MRERRERAALPNPAAPTLHRKPEFCSDEAPAHVRLREAVEAYVDGGGTIKKYPAQVAPVFNLDGETVNIFENEVLRNADYGIYWN